jgi:hypothetical protein
MDKILIVGHPQSGHDTIEHLLAAAGMAPARPSRREGLRPDEISSALCRANTRALLDDRDGNGAFQQLDIGPIWQGLALDLLLANLDQSVWGWSDPQSVVLLDYWRTIDPGITFVLVYAPPDSVLTGMSREEASQLTPHRLGRLLRNWSACNEALLRFFLHHPERCLLVQSQQVHASPHITLQQVQGRLQGTGTLRIGADLPLHRIAPPVADPARVFLSAALVRAHPDSLHLYEALQASAHVPEARTSSCSGTVTPLAAWLDLARLSDARLALRQCAAEQHTRIEALGQDLADRDALLQEQRQHTHQLATEVQSLTAERQRTAHLVTGHQEQEARLARDLARQHQHLAEREAALQTANAHIAQLQAARTAQEQSNQQVQEHQAQLLGQIHQVQLHLETQYLQRKQLGAEVQSLQADLQRTEHLAAERQAQLTVLNRQAEQQTRRLTDRDAELKAATTHLGQLQDALAHQEQERARRDAAHRASEAQMAQRLEQGDHLHTQLQAQAGLYQSRWQEATAASTAMAQENAQLIAQLHQVQQELERHFLELQTFRQAQAQARAAAATPPAPVGAAERVKSHLSYRLGATMVQHSGSLGGWLRMPFALVRVTRQYRREHQARASVKLPPLHQYRDAQEAERVKRHLSYRLGQTLVQHATTPVGWLSLPFALQREVRDFRLQRQP